MNMLAPVMRPSGGFTARPRCVAVRAASAGVPLSKVYDVLKGKEVIRSSDGAKLDIPSLWTANERAVVAFARSMGLNRDCRPPLGARGVKLFLVSIGTFERSIEFSAQTGFPRELLLADPDSVTYEALGLVKGVAATFLGWQTAVSFNERMGRAGGMDDLNAVLPRWTSAQRAQGVWTPPRQEQALQQGGMFVFDGPRCVWSHYDAATGAHADLAGVVSLAGAAAGAAAAREAQDCPLPPSGGGSGGA